MAVRIQLVGMFAVERNDGSRSVVEQHLGPFRLGEGEDPTLARFSQQLQQLVSIQGPPGQQHFRFEYSCYGHRVPILSDVALKEAFSYFRDLQAAQQQQPGHPWPQNPAASCTLYLWPSETPGPWTLSDYMAEARNIPTTEGSNPRRSLEGQPSDGAGVLAQPVAAIKPELSPSSSSRGLDRCGSSSNRGQAAAAVVVAAAATAGGGRTAAQGAAATPGAPDAYLTPSAAAASGGVGGGVLLRLSPIAAAAAPGLHSVESDGSAGGSDSEMQQQHFNPAAAAAAAGCKDTAADGLAVDSSDVSVGVSRSSSLELQQPAAAVVGGQYTGLRAVVSLQHPNTAAVGGDATVAADGAAAAAAVPAEAAPRRQQQQQQKLRSSVKRHAEEGHDTLEGRQDPHAKQLQWQLQQQQAALLLPRDPTAAAAALSSGLSEANSALSPSWSAGSSRADSAAAAAAAARGPDESTAGIAQQQIDSNKSARTTTAQSPRSQQQQQIQQQQQQLALLFQQQQQALLHGMTPAQAWFTAHEQQQQVGAGVAGMVSPFSSSGGAAPAAAAAGNNNAAAAAAFGSVQQVVLDGENSPLSHHQAVAAAGGGGGGSPLGLSLSPSGFMTLDQLQQLQISSISGPYTLQEVVQVNPYGPAAGGVTAAAAGGSDLATNPQAAAAAVDATPPVLPMWQQQQQQQQPPQHVVTGGRLKVETKTKYADGRFKDESRHQQRLSDMRERCNALFDGVIQGHFQVEHHKKVVCLVCNAVVVPYEAYHIDAVRKHFVRHHEPWLAEAGCNVDVWRKSCAPIGKALAAAGGAGTRAATAAAKSSCRISQAAVAAAAADAGSSGEAAEAAAAAAAHEASAADDGGVEDAAVRSGGRQSSTRLADGRYKDPVQHEQRMAEMEARCAALFNGAVSAHWSITSHRSISCHLCRSTITPYAAYHPDCLRKHFVRRHEDVLIAAGVDVAAWSKGIPLGRRKLKAMMMAQQQQQQELMMMTLAQHQHQHQAFAQSLQLQQQQQGFLPAASPAAAASALLFPAQLGSGNLQAAAAAAGLAPALSAQLSSHSEAQLGLLQHMHYPGQGLHQAQNPNLALLPLAGDVAAAVGVAAPAVAPPAAAGTQPMWSWLTTGSQQQQQQQQVMGGVSAAIVAGDQHQLQQQQCFVFGGSSSPMTLPVSTPQGWQQQQWPVPAASAAAAAAAETSGSAAAAVAELPFSEPLMAVVGFGDNVDLSGFNHNNSSPQLTGDQPSMRINSSSSSSNGRNQSLQHPDAITPGLASGVTVAQADLTWDTACCPMEFQQDAACCPVGVDLPQQAQQQQQLDSGLKGGVAAAAVSSVSAATAFSVGAVAPAAGVRVNAAASACDIMPLPQQQPFTPLPLLPSLPHLQQQGQGGLLRSLMELPAGASSSAQASSTINAAAAAKPAGAAMSGVVTPTSYGPASCALPPLGPPNTQQQQQKAEGFENRSWVRELAAEWARSPSLADLPPGFGPMSLSPAAAAAEAGLAGGACAAAGSLSDIELAAFLAAEEDGADLDGMLLKHANWVFETS